MRDEIKNSQVAQNGSTISNSKNQTTISLKRIRTESAISGFISGIIAAIIGTYIYEHFIK